MGRVSAGVTARFKGAGWIGCAGESFACVGVAVVLALFAPAKD
jgi:hypothetical protein